MAARVAWLVLYITVASLIVALVVKISLTGGLGLDESQTQGKKSLWDLLEVAGVPVALTGLGIWFQQQQRNRQNQEDKEEVIQRYFDNISWLLIEKRLIEAAEASKMISDDHRDPLVESAKEVIRARTLQIIRRLRGDARNQSAIFQFLHETGINDKLKLSLGTNLRKEDFRGVRFCDVDLSQADLRDSRLDGAMLMFSDLSRANLSWASLCMADLSWTHLELAILHGANLSGANLEWAHLEGCNLDRGRPQRTDLSGAILCRANLSLANLYAAILIEANLEKANLRQVNLQAAILHNANFSKANLWYADLSGADLSGANLSGANLNKADLEDVRWNKETKWPDCSHLEGAHNIPSDLVEKLRL